VSASLEHLHVDPDQRDLLQEGVALSGSPDFLSFLLPLGNAKLACYAVRPANTIPNSKAIKPRKPLRNGVNFKNK
jgi:hypothetical protein